MPLTTEHKAIIRIILSSYAMFANVKFSLEEKRLQKAIQKYFFWV